MKPNGYLASLVFSVATSVAVFAGGVHADRSPAAAAPVEAALDLYERGEFDAAIRTIPAHTLTVDAFISDADRWIGTQAGPASPRRRMIAAAFTAELISARFIDTKDRWPWSNSAAFLSGNSTVSGAATHRWPVDSEDAAFPLLSWACTKMPSSGDVSAPERWWWLASVALFEESRLWRALVGALHTNESGPGIARESADGHLSHARRRLPGEPRWQMAEAISRVVLTNVRGRPFGRPELLANRETTNANDDRKLLEAERLFEPLLHDAVLSGEAELRIAQLELRRRQWANALVHLDRARPLVGSDPTLAAATDYFAGWAYEQLSRTDDAVAAYRRAHERAPQLRQVATLFAGQLMLAHQPADAYDVLSHAFDADPEPLDLVVRVELADARFMPNYIRRMREALR